MKYAKPAKNLHRLAKDTGRVQANISLKEFLRGIENCHIRCDSPERHIAYHYLKHIKGDRFLTLDDPDLT